MTKNTRLLLERYMRYASKDHMAGLLGLHIPRDKNHLLRMVMEPSYCADEVVGHPSHQLII